MGKKVKLLKRSNFTFFHNIFYASCILKSWSSHISVVFCSLFEFGTVSKWCNREWVKNLTISFREVWRISFNIVQKASHYQSHVSWWIKSWKRSSKEDFCEIISKADKQFQKKKIKNFFYVLIVQIAPHLQRLVSQGIKISQTVVKRVPGG